MDEYGSRTKRLPAPPHVVWDDLVARKAAGLRAWLLLREDEVVPEVLESQRPDRVVWSSLWPGRPGDRVELTMAPADGGTAVTFRLLTADEPPDERLRRHLLYRMNELLYRDLRYSYGN